MATKSISQARCTLSEAHTLPRSKAEVRQTTSTWVEYQWCKCLFTVPQFLAGNDRDFGVAIKRECSRSSCLWYYTLGLWDFISEFYVQFPNI